MRTPGESGVVLFPVVLKGLHSLVGVGVNLGTISSSFSRT